MYAMPESIDDLIDFVVGKALDVLGVDHALFPRWGQQDTAAAGTHR
jgi:4-hydroxy-3-polyprenylbenzoate decarboxylase